MSKTTIGLLAVTFISLGAVIYMGTRKADLLGSRETPSQTTAQSSQPQQQTPVTGVASGKDTIVMIFNKQSAQQIVGALQNQFPTTQNAPQLTVQQFIGTQGVFNYLEQVIYKKWPDMAPKQAVSPTQQPVNK